MIVALQVSMHVSDMGIVDVSDSLGSNGRLLVFQVGGAPWLVNMPACGWKAGVTHPPDFQPGWGQPAFCSSSRVNWDPVVMIHDRHIHRPRLELPVQYDPLGC